MYTYKYSTEDWNRYRHIEVRPFDAALGAEVRCGDLRTATDSTFAEIRKAWFDHLVLLFPDQTLSDDELLAFGARFGTLDDTERPQPKDQPNGQHQTLKALGVVSNVIESGKPIGGLSNSDLFWHTDMSYFKTPPDASLLYALEVPSEGGETGFCNMYLALETLPEDLRSRITKMKIKHDATHNSAGFLRNGFDRPTDVSVSPGVSHPALRTHPETGRNALYLGRRPFSYIEGLSNAESETLLDSLWAHASSPNLAWHHKWAPGDIIIWDNRCSMHRRNTFPNTERRVMHRTQIKGTIPYIDPQLASQSYHPRGRARVPA